MADLAPALRKAPRQGNQCENYSADEFRTKVAEGDQFLKTVLKGDLQLVKGEQRDLDAVTGKLKYRFSIGHITARINKCNPRESGPAGSMNARRQSVNLAIKGE